MRDEAPLQRGRVVRTQSGFFTVETPNGEYVVCQISGRLKIGALRAEQREDASRSDLVALNDFVTFELQTDGTGFIVEVGDRFNVLSRTEPGAKVGTSAETEQIIIVNVDQAIFVFAAEQPRPQPRALDRLLVIAEKAEIPDIVVIINKIDIADREATKSLFKVYEDIGYPVLYVSAETSENIEQLRDVLVGKDKVSVFTGPSGVGKSSLLNAIQAGLQLDTSDVSAATTKGKHTTRFSQLLELNEGGYVADTPGIRAIAPWDIEPDELDGYFVEFYDYIAQCKFKDCSHIHEPGCAVREAVEAGDISKGRYDSYLRLREELEEQYIY
ncbi:MAG: ribosome small subunit-dependent GTPase A [Chloroflexi bacterium]|nr:ribosome small subunit-dependent GTPase A [Chloroflexota bacterium]